MNFLVPHQKGKISPHELSLSELHGFSLDLPPQKSTKALQFHTSFSHISQGQIVKGCYDRFIGFIIMKPYISDVFFCACLSLLESLRKVSSFGDRGWGECGPGPSNWIKGVSCISSRCFRWKCCCRILSLRTDMEETIVLLVFPMDLWWLRPLNECVVFSFFL